jgi:hypothetical protein
MKNLIADTIGKIKREHLLPDPKWKYLVKKYGIWVTFILVVMMGAGSFSAAYFLLASLDWDLYRFMQQNMLRYSLSIFPFFWVIMIGIFLAAAFFDIRKTETGYRFSLLKISLIIIGSVIILGFVMSFIGLGARFNSMMATGVPFYGQHMMVTKEEQWSNPAQGFLAGTIIASSSSELKIVDLNKKTWNILLNESILITPRAEISEGQMIKVIGTLIGNNNFQASEIRPWVGMGQGMMGGGYQRGMMRRN